MWERLSEPWRECFRLAWESYCEGSVPIAAVITNAQGEMISKGRNRSATLPPPDRNQIVGGPLAHAEVNAMLALDWDSIDRSSVELFTLVEPCPLCIGAVCMAGVKKVRYAARDAWSGSTNLLEASPYFRWKRIEAYSAEDPGLEAIIHMQQVDWELSRSHLRAEEVIGAWREAYPEHVRKGCRLFESGEMRAMKADGVSAREVVERLQELSVAFERGSA